MPKLYIDLSNAVPPARYCVAGAGNSWWLLCGAPPPGLSGFGGGESPWFAGREGYESLDIDDSEAAHLCDTYTTEGQEPALKAWIDAKRAEAGPPEQRLPAGALDADGDPRTITLTASPSEGSPFLPASAGRGIMDGVPGPTPGQCLDVLVANLMGQPAHLREPLLELAHAAVREDPC